MCLVALSLQEGSLEAALAQAKGQKEKAGSHDDFEACRGVAVSHGRWRNVKKTDPTLFMESCLSLREGGGCRHVEAGAGTVGAKQTLLRRYASADLQFGGGMAR